MTPIAFASDPWNCLEILRLLGLAGLGSSC